LLPQLAICRLDVPVALIRSRCSTAESSGWLSVGVLGFASFNGLIHLAIGQGFQGFMTSFASGYAIAVIPAVTENAWGSTVVQTLTDAVGNL
jgi:hypothetical protein